ncbi:hypothetical protein [Paenibacillus herberti]|uniref:Uncharacterized protein n=1 Tax=Paenibacillus herberti TaxID=1619309 RepID=A0A229NTW1_9BACL|nr:hypothetical protein [Paenibacillus herberti]OXM13343.1 hypothetical protein CGZ75_19950 [Paenibacillus herberti]
MFTIQAGQLAIHINDKGIIDGLIGSTDSLRYESSAHSSPLLRLVADGELHAPVRATEESSGKIRLGFQGGTEVVVAAASQSSYMTFEVLQIENGRPDAVIWGPYLTTIDSSIGESVGVVHDGQFAIGLQVLNPKTVGGWPLEIARHEAMPKSYSQGGKPDSNSPEMGDNKFEHHVSTAWPTLNGGSGLQAFARDRSKRATRPVWNVRAAEVTPIGGEDAEIVGTRIALFGCPVDRVLDTIEAIELGEHLPHPIIEGVWGKRSPAANQSYLITDFTESTISEALKYAKMAGVNYIYHPDPFVQWGHFKLKPSNFPSGDEGLKACSELAASEGIHVGIHTLSNFTTLNDPYVTPIPDERLQPVGTSTLTGSMSADDTVIGIGEPLAFTAALFRRTAKIGDELIEYEAVSEAAPWTLLGVKRGVNGTSAAAHEEGSAIARLWDHPYDVVFPGIELQDEYADRITDLMNGAQLKQISFDGLEGVYAAGQDDYGVVRFVEKQFRSWQQEVINDASFVVPNYLWHVFTRFNWGEPWGAETREGQMESRLSNQRYFARNFIPPMLGWFLIRSASDRFEATALDEIEWVLSKASGFGAGFALVSDFVVLKRNGNIDILLEAVHQWEAARRAGAFTAEQRERMSDPKGDWHLEPAGPGEWTLYPVQVTKPFVCSPSELQPGQPGGSDWAMFNKFEPQPLRFTMRVRPVYGNEDASVKRPTFYTDGAYMTFDTEIKANQYLTCDGDRIGRVYDANWNLLHTVEASADAPTVRHGGQSLSFSCKFEGDPKPDVNVKVFLRGMPETASANRSR